MASAQGHPRAGDRVAALLERRTRANEAFFSSEAARIAALCKLLAERFLAGGRLIAVGGSPQDWSDAHHVAVEFVHPVIVGKRALPAVAVGPEEAALLAEAGDILVSFEPLTVAGEEIDPGGDDPFLRQELAETAYHLLWELVHVFFEHLDHSDAGAGASDFLYPFLGRRDVDLAPVVEDVRRSVLMKAMEIGALRRQTLEEGAGELQAAADAVGRSLARGGQLLAFGNGGSATDAEDVVADFRAAPQGWRSRRAVDLSADSAILTALANDIGPAVLFQRQIIAYGRPGDVALGFSTSGNSLNVIEAMVEARRRGLVTAAMVGYDGGRLAAERLADHVIVSRSEHIPRIQEAHASAYHVLRELVEAGG